MSKIVLITGSSAGIGYASAIYFAKKGWNVIATMRDAKNKNIFEQYPQSNCFSTGCY
ncbi:TPA: SDR family NAD(P)-dependent oxidoreductase [Candidatus Woesearchaeota archaeon]|nr:SDR family NAD(P)-dependent oxidoreductase [Candidatus Woesearchaeota archaeon]